MLDRVDDICSNSAGRGELSGAPSVEHHIPDGISPDHNSVEHSFHARHLLIGGDQMGRYIGHHLAVLLQNGSAQQLNLHSGCLGQCHILGGHAGDALSGHLRRVNVPAKAQGSQNADLPAGIKALYIRSGIRLGIALFLGLLQRRVER